MLTSKFPPISYPPLLAPLHAENKKPANPPAYQCCTHQQPDKESCWIRASDDPVAAFTGILAIATIGLWFFTFKLWKATNRAVIDAAENSNQQVVHMQESIIEAANAAKSLIRN